MILPISIYGSTVLRKDAEEIDENYPKLAELIANMYETMAKADGVGLAAPQVGLPIRMFVVDGTPMAEEDKTLEGFKKVFINPVILSEEGEQWAFVEGCLSIPDIHETVFRKPIIEIEYFNENFELITEKFDGYKARIIQHEYDHLDGVLFTDKISPIKKRMLRNRLTALSKGKFAARYKIRIPRRG